MRVTNEAGYTVDTDPARLDVDRVYAWLSTQAYWAIGRERARVETSIANSRCYGLYDPAGEQVGFCRMVTDDATFAWLCDVFIAPTARGGGLGTWLVQRATDDIFSTGVHRILLATRDAHGVYGKIGYTPLVEPGRWMEIHPAVR